MDNFINIFFYLDKNDLLNSQLICKIWNNILNSLKFFYKRLGKLSNDEQAITCNFPKNITTLLKIENYRSLLLLKSKYEEELDHEKWKNVIEHFLNPKNLPLVLNAVPTNNNRFYVLVLDSVIWKERNSFESSKYLCIYEVSKAEKKFIYKSKLLKPRESLDSLFQFLPKINILDQVEYTQSMDLISIFVLCNLMHKQIDELYFIIKKLKMRN